jgi:NADH pyrophosphatase NudC (nudix superfamily)
LNITYLAEANENEDLTVNVDENKGVKWFAFDEALQASKEEWFVDRIYKKLIKKVRELDNGAK